jgi:hypothetical protein
MSTLYDRLLQICQDFGVKDPQNCDIQAVTKLSSGRVSQIKKEREAAKIGANTLERLYRLGYSTEWVTTGKGLQRWKSKNGENLHLGNQAQDDLTQTPGVVIEFRRR